MKGLVGGPLLVGGLGPGPPGPPLKSGPVLNKKQGVVFGPRNGYPVATNVVLVLLLFLVVLSDLRYAKAFLFRNRSSPNFACT